MHVVVIPIINLWGYVEYDRRCGEMDLILVYWQREGNSAKLAIDTIVFPDLNGRYQPEDYMTALISV